MQRVNKETVPCRKSIVVTAEDRTIRQDELLEEREVVLAHRVTDIDRTTGDRPRGSVELSTRVGGLEHVPVRVYEVAHPQAVVGTMHHVTPLQPVCAVDITVWISRPKVIP